MRNKHACEPSKQEQALIDVQALVSQDEFLKPAVLDLQVYEEMLIVLTDHQLPNAFVEKVVGNSWPGPVEVHCATDLMMGA